MGGVAKVEVCAQLFARACAGGAVTLTGESSCVLRVRGQGYVFERYLAGARVLALSLRCGFFHGTFFMNVPARARVYCLGARSGTFPGPSAERTAGDGHALRSLAAAGLAAATDAAGAARFA